MSTVTAPRRVAVLAGIVALAVLAAVLGQPSTARHPIRIGNDDGPLQIGARVLVAPDVAARHAATPVASTLGAVSTTWFCGGGSPSSSGGLSTHLILVNRAAAMTTATIDFVSSTGGRHTTSVEVAGRTAMTVNASGVGDKGSVAAVVEARGGGLVVSQRIGAAEAVTVAACATASSDSWFFSGGDTQKGSTEQLVLFNPFNDLATADVSFLTADGFRHPQETQGLPVSARSLLVVDVASVQNRRKDLASMVTTRAGRLVVWRTQRFDGSGPELPAAFSPSGVSVSLGATTALDRFALPTAVTGDGVVTRIVLSNPGTEDATVRLRFTPDDPSTNGQPPATSTKVGAGSVVVLGTARASPDPAGGAVHGHRRGDQGRTGGCRALARRRRTGQGARRQRDHRDPCRGAAVGGSQRTAEPEPRPAGDHRAGEGRELHGLGGRPGPVDPGCRHVGAAPGRRGWARHGRPLGGVGRPPRRDRRGARASPSW